MTGEMTARRLPIGTETVDGGTSVRVWAPGHASVWLVVEGARDDDGAAEVQLAPEGDGHWSGVADGVGAGARYRLRVDDGAPLPDPASRFQPEGPHGPSEVIDPSTFDWSDQAWTGPDPVRPAIYELHIGTYTPEGTFAAAAEHLGELAELGIGIIELMPLAEFPGAFGWGYDGVDLFAPMHIYGRPDDLRRFVDQAHAAGLGVIIDVVYNHFGPDGCYVAAFSDTYFSSLRRSEWGDTPNFDGMGADGVRELILANVRMWIAEYHFDGLRLDATQQIFDIGPDHILAALTREVGDAAGGRQTLVIAENDLQEARLARAPQVGGFGIQALWNDDLHHAAMVALTGDNEAYYSDYRGTPQEFISAAKHGYLYQGQRSSWQAVARGTPALDLGPEAFVAFLQNHDQVANSARGERLSAITDPGRLRALTTYLLLTPPRPLLFMGQEWASSAPFLYFADHESPLAEAVNEGRRTFLSQFPSLADPAVLEGLPLPSDRATFEASRLDHAERERPSHAHWLALHRNLLALRRAWDETSGGPMEVDGAVIGEFAFCLRFFPRGERSGSSGRDRLLVVNLGARPALWPAPEPLLAPPLGTRWNLVLSSEDPRYGGGGTPQPDSDRGWNLPAEAAVVLEPVPRPPASDPISATRALSSGS